MKATVLRDQATTPDGRPMTLHEHDGDFTIRVGGVELMSTRQHHSEERLAEMATARLKKRPRPRVLIGGLGMGFTLRAALARLGPEARVVVAELMPAVVAWNLDPAYGLGADALADRRVELVTGDVIDLLAKHPAAYDAIILDVDNGASGLSTGSNSRLYSSAGLGLAGAALRPGGCLAIWSAGDDPTFVERMRRSGFAVTVERARTHATGGGWVTLFLGTAAA
jgi:spermidine synthase